MYEIIKIMNRFTQQNTTAHVLSFTHVFDHIGGLSVFSSKAVLFSATYLNNNKSDRKIYQLLCHLLSLVAIPLLDTVTHHVID